MHSCFCMLVIVSVFISISSATEVNISDFVNSIVVHRPPQEQQSTPRSDGGNRRKRSISSSDRANIINKINSLRSSVGASNMNYLTYSSSIEDDAANWTKYCDFYATLYTRSYTDSASFTLRVVTSNPPNHVSLLEEDFNDLNFHYALSSVYLQYVGADSWYCSSVLAKGQNVTSVYLTAYVFSYTSLFNNTEQQYTLGEQCTTCLSGSYWCYEGLCKDDCSDSDSNCYCNSYCLNCANTDRTSCRCRCLEGWTGSRCETRNVLNATTPTCSTTSRISRTSTTTSTTTIAPSTTTSTTRIAPSTTTSTTSIAPSTTTSTTRIAPSTTTSTTSIAPSTTTSTTRIAPSTTTSTTRIAPAITKSTNKPNDAVTTSCSLKNLLFQLAFYATVALFLRF